jgi:site-specific DNA-methyltransferase (adenine-specific)
MFSLMQGDCLERMKEIPDSSVDMILADPPYGTTNCKWDSVIPLELMWEQLNRIIKSNGAIVLTAQTPFDKVLGCSNLSMLKYEWIWEKTQATGFLNAKKAPMKAHENILVFYKKQPIYNFQKTENHKPMNSYTKKAEVQNKTSVYGKVKEDVSGGGDTTRYPRSVLVFSSDKQKTKLDGTIHPTQKPVALMEYLVKTYTNEGETVLDFCMGSGTTGVACAKNNRNFIGIELDEGYFEIASKRIADAKEKQTI